MNANHSSAYVYMHTSENEDTHLSCHACVSIRHVRIPPYLGQGLSLIGANTNITGLWTSRCSFVFASHITVGTLGFQTHATVLSLTYVPGIWTQFLGLVVQILSSSFEATLFTFKTYLSSTTTPSAIRPMRYTHCILDHYHTTLELS